MTLREIAAELGLRHDGRRALAKLSARLRTAAKSRKCRAGGSSFPPSANAGCAHGRQMWRVRRRPGKRIVRKLRRVPRDANPAHFADALLLIRMATDLWFPISPSRELMAICFIGRDAMGDAMHGDTVFARVERRDRRGARKAASSEWCGARTRPSSDYFATVRARKCCAALRIASRRNCDSAWRRTAAGACRQT